jgi:uncharacterized membrane protein
MRFAHAFVTAALAASHAYAGLAVCNKGGHPATVALGHFNGANWASEGWWTIAPRKCESLIATPLDARYYYLYATDGASGTWGGGRSFCTAAANKFSIVGRGHCSGRGFDQRGFFEVDTGKLPNWTQSLSD